MSIKIYGWVPMIRMSDMRYPVYLSDFKAENTNVSTGAFVYEEGMAEFGYYPVIDVEIPQGDVVTEGRPQQGEDGVWYKTWIARDYTEEEIAENLRREKEQRTYSAKSNFENENMNGFQFGDHLLSLDYNSISLYHSIIVAAQYAEENKIFSLMTQDNKVVELTRDDMIVELETAISEYVGAYNNLCDYVKELDQIEKIEDLPEVPYSFR